jgi:hypothetical protein
MDTLLTVIISISSSGVVTLLVRTFFTEKIKSSIQNDYNVKIENLRNELQNKSSILQSVLSSQVQTYQGGHEERISAIKEFWNKYLELRNNLSKISEVDEILTESEFNERYGESTEDIDDFEQSMRDFHRTMNELSGDQVEKTRPFLSENLWANFILLKTFQGRLRYLYTPIKNKKIKHWKTDGALTSLIKRGLTEEEFEYIQRIDRGSIKYVKFFIEQKVLSEIQKIVTGQIAADNTFKQAIKLAELQELPISAVSK